MYRILSRLVVLLVLHCLHNTVSSVRMSVLFPYARTTIYCPNSSTVAAVDVHDPQWSGSAHCTQQQTVAQLAQARAGYAMGANLIVQFISISALGAIGDCWGRKPAMIIAWTGILVEALVNAVWGDYTALVTGRIAQGITGAYAMIVSATIADMSNIDDVRCCCWW